VINARHPARTQLISTIFRHRVLEIWSKISVPESTFTRSMFETSSVTANDLNSFSARRTQLRGCHLFDSSRDRVADLPLKSGGAPRIGRRSPTDGTRPGGIRGSPVGETVARLRRSSDPARRRMEHSSSGRPSSNQRGRLRTLRLLNPAYWVRLLAAAST